ncbi:hypothetical protein NE237_022533 [Protea cynaroides]|uniref:non-specific serine/threonine protein kinase n=1 Tax=Protea cynaroides TaxID=273540 RepID=A0A9Q0HB78_9MAGN|nr:hypothetical protein NE237_022533 [Protea cynaroides]
MGKFQPLQLQISNRIAVAAFKAPDDDPCRDRSVSEHPLIGFRMILPVCPPWSGVRIALEGEGLRFHLRGCPNYEAPTSFIGKLGFFKDLKLTFNWLTTPRVVKLTAENVDEVVRELPDANLVRMMRMLRSSQGTVTKHGWRESQILHCGVRMVTSFVFLSNSEAFSSLGWSNSSNGWKDEFLTCLLGPNRFGVQVSSSRQQTYCGRQFHVARTIFQLIFASDSFLFRVHICWREHRQKTFANVLHKELKFPRRIQIPPLSMCLFNYLERTRRQRMYNKMMECLFRPWISFRGAGHSSAIDWTLGILLDPADRLVSTNGANEIKQHPFYCGINWPLIRCMIHPPLAVPLQLFGKNSKANDVQWDDGVLVRSLDFFKGIAEGHKFVQEQVPKECKSFRMSVDMAVCSVHA